MKVCVIKDRCEVDGDIFLPGEEVELSDEQYASLLSMGAVYQTVVDEEESDSDIE